VKPRITSERISEPEALFCTTSPSVREPAPVPSISIFGVPAKPGWVVPSMMTGAVIAGSGLVG